MRRRMRHAVRTPVFALAAIVGLGLALAPAECSADVQHVIGKGHTIEAIAHRYHVTVKAIMDANGLKDTKHLKPGDTLIIPGVKEKGKDGKKDAHAQQGGNKGPQANATHPTAEAQHGNA